MLTTLYHIMSVVSYGPECDLGSSLISQAGLLVGLVRLWSVIAPVESSTLHFGI